jgi:hypothetical protein
MSNCNNLVRSLDPTCDALNKIAGVNKRIFIGQLSQLDSYSVDINTLDITAIAMNLNGSIAYTLQKFIGKKLKNSASSELEVGDNISVFNQKVTLVLYHFTSKDKQAIENLVASEDLFAFVETNANQIEVYGIDTVGSLSSSDPIGGLNASEGSGGTGTALNDDTAFTLTLSGQHRVISRIFQRPSGATHAANLAYLEALT